MNGAPLTRETAERATDARESQKLRRVLRSIPPTVASGRPIESILTDQGTNREIAAPKSKSSSTAQRRDTLDVSPPQALRETRDDAASDPGAIIDWLLNEGARKER